MKFFFTLIFVFTAYLTPQTLFGDLATYHVKVIVALITLLASLFTANGSGAPKLPQT